MSGDVVSIAPRRELVFAPLPYKLVDTGARLFVVPYGGLRHVAEVNPYRDNAVEIGNSIVRASNAHRELVGALRLLAACAKAQQMRPSPQAVIDLRNATATALDVLRTHA